MGTANAQDSTKCKCCTPEYRQFDFWIGDWEVKDSSGKVLGYNKITQIEGGCGLQENWTSGKPGYTGQSMSFYDRTTGNWNQTWVDNGGGVIMMDGKLIDGAMVMMSGDNLVQNRTEWKPLDDGRVLHTWNQTKDGGVTWITVFKGYYNKK